MEPLTVKELAEGPGEETPGTLIAFAGIQIQLHFQIMRLASREESGRRLHTRLFMGNKAAT